MSSLRVEKVKSDLKKALGEAIFELNKFVVVSDISLSPDLRNAKVEVISVLKDKDRNELVAELNGKIGLIKKGMSKKVSLRYFPKITFLMDTHIDRIEKAEAMLKSVD